MSHTPGPWNMHTDGCNQVWTTEGIVAIVRDGNDEGINDSEQATSNARLIAAAPELLEALQKLMREPLGDFIYDIRDSEMQGWDGPRVTNWGEACILAKTAIAKAEGTKGGES